MNGISLVRDTYTASIHPTAGMDGCMHQICLDLV